MEVGISANQQDFLGYSMEKVLVQEKELRMDDLDCTQARVFHTFIEFVSSNRNEELGATCCCQSEPPQNFQTV